MIKPRGCGKHYPQGWCAMPLNLPLPPLPVPTWVVFCDAPDVWWLRPLRRGFRHCFVVMRHKRTYITIDPLLGSIEVMTHPVRRDGDLIQILKDQGLTVVSVNINRDYYRGNIGMMCTCVTIVKRILNLYAPLIQTPYALYRHLTKAVIPAQAGIQTPISLDAHFRGNDTQNNNPNLKRTNHDLAS